MENYLSYACAHRNCLNSRFLPHVPLVIPLEKTKENIHIVREETEKCLLKTRMWSENTNI